MRLDGQSGTRMRGHSLCASRLYPPEAAESFALVLPVIAPKLYLRMSAQCQRKHPATEGVHGKLSNRLSVFPSISTASMFETQGMCLCR